jgi:glutamate---cysteine ligase / carboxylate-amine ligase
MVLRKLGVEEELLLVDPETRQLSAVAVRAVRAHDGAAAEPDPRDGSVAEVENELFLQQIETATPPCDTADEVRQHLRRGRRAVGEAAAAAGARAVAMPTPVLADPDERFTPKPRYQRIGDDYGELARQALVCAMHVHVDVADDEEGVAVIDRIRPWLPVLVALSANSPYWRGRDTGHASWRSQTWSRWPSAGPQEPFGDVGTYREVSARMLESGASLDSGMLYFDIRLSEKFPTVEVRVADVCTEVDDAVLVSLLSRALVETSAQAWRAGEPVAVHRTDLLRTAAWRAGRYGLAGPLVHPATQRIAPVREVFAALLDHVRKALEETGDEALVVDLFERAVARGGGAARQRSVLEASGDLTAVVDDLVGRTERSSA